MEEHRLALKPGYQIEHFRIESVLGKGGFGITYVALDLQLGKRVAIKELLPDSIATRVDGSTVVPHSASLQENWEWARERFLDEARVLAGFSHPAIVGVHRLIEANGTVYMVMDYVDGESYEARLRRIGHEPDAASLMAVIGPILRGLDEVHAAGLIHRDIKPENILINRHGQPVLIDFGSARLSVGATMTMTSIVTHGYSPIEQYQTKGKMGPWTDIYALGAVMCRAITGEKPPVAADRIVDDDFPWLSYRSPAGFSTPFLQAVDWALRVRTEERPQGISQWEKHLRGAGESLQGSGIPPVFGEDSMGRMPMPHGMEESVGTPAPRSRSEELRAEPQASQDGHPPKKRKAQPILIAGVAGIVLLGTLLATGMVVQSREAEKRLKAARLTENQKAAEQLRTAQEAAAGEVKAEADRKAEEQARLAREAEAARKAAEEQARLAREAAEEHARLAREAEAAKAEASKKATKESPFENSLGMKFVPVPGTDVLFSVWDTRVKDFRAYANTTGYRQEVGVFTNASWEGPGFSQTDYHPVVQVSWNEAKAFCEWLTTKERSEGKIGKDQEYRLPRDAEWSVAVGLPLENGTTPQEKDGKANGVYPWGTQWPPPRGVGNYNPSLGVDSFPNTSPVGSFAPNRFGLYDIGGNVWQWCEDQYSSSETSPVVRGGAWFNDSSERLLSSRRRIARPALRDTDCGFRCVLEIK